MEGWVALVLLVGGLFLAGCLRVVFRPATMLATGGLVLSYAGFVIYQTVGHGLQAGSRRNSGPCSRRRHFARHLGRRPSPSVVNEFTAPAEQEY